MPLKAGGFMRHLIIAASLFVIILTSGCAAHELCNDQDKIRCCLLDLYTNQIMDNLIRAENGMPFIQLDYTNAGATVTITENANLSGNQMATSTTLLTLGGRSSSATKMKTMTQNSGATTGSMLSIVGTAMVTFAANSLAATRSIVTSFGYGASAGNSNQVTMTATPVTNSNEVYDAYLEFLTLPGSLVKTCDPPPEGAAHICKKCGKEYYWVPVQYKTEFLRLSLITTAQRGKTLLTTEDYFSVTLKKVINERPGQFGNVKLLRAPKITWPSQVLPGIIDVISNNNNTIA
jgi:hypothetical protein